MGAALLETHQLLVTILDAVYIDLKSSKSILSVKLNQLSKSNLGQPAEFAYASPSSSASGNGRARSIYIHRDSLVCHLVESIEIDP